MPERLARDMAPGMTSRRSRGQSGGSNHPAELNDRALAPGVRRGYTCGMKTAVSIPDDVFQDAERLARRAKKSRSRIFSEALEEYVARHAPDEVTDAMDRTVALVGETPDKFITAAARRVLERTEW